MYMLFQIIWAKAWNKFRKLDGVCFTNGCHLLILDMALAECFVFRTEVRNSSILIVTIKCYARPVNQTLFRNYIDEHNVVDFGFVVQYE